MQDTGYAVQRTVYEAVVFGSVRFGEVDGGIVVFDGIEHEKELFTGGGGGTTVAASIPPRKKHGEQDSPEQRVAPAMRTRLFPERTASTLCRQPRL